MIEIETILEARSKKQTNKKRTLPLSVMADFSDTCIAELHCALWWTNYNTDNMVKVSICHLSANFVVVNYHIINNKNDLSENSYNIGKLYCIRY